MQASPHFSPAAVRWVEGGRKRGCSSECSATSRGVGRYEAFYAAHRGCRTSVFRVVADTLSRWGPGRVPMAAAVFGHCSVYSKSCWSRRTQRPIHCRERLLIGITSSQRQVHPPHAHLHLRPVSSTAPAGIVSVCARAHCSALQPQPPQPHQHIRQRRQMQPQRRLARSVSVQLMRSASTQLLLDAELNRPGAPAGFSASPRPQ